MLVEPHERRLDRECAGHTQIEGHLQRLHGVITAVGIAGKICLAHPSHQYLESASVSQGSGDRHEQQITSRDKGIGQTVGLHFDVDLLRHGGVRNGGNE